MRTPRLGGVPPIRENGKEGEGEGERRLAPLDRESSCPGQATRRPCEIGQMNPKATTPGPDLEPLQPDPEPRSTRRTGAEAPEVRTR